jgi:hypothetical protein
MNVSRSSPKDTIASQRPQDHSAHVAWQVSLGVHLVVFALVADRAWIAPLDFSARKPVGDSHVSEGIAYLSVTQQSPPTTRGVATKPRSAVNPSTVAISPPTALEAPTDDVAQLPARPVTAVPDESGLGVDTVSHAQAGRSFVIVAPMRTRMGLVTIDELRIGSALTIAATSDSIRLKTEQERAAMDWTLKTGDGARIGVSPGRLHLGPLALPLPFLISLRDVGPDQRARRRMFAEIRAQVDRAVRDSIVSGMLSELRQRRAGKARPFQ